MQSGFGQLVAMHVAAVLLFCGAVAAWGQQLPVQTLGGSSSDQSNCSPSDPNCAGTANQIPFESRTPQQTGTSFPTGAVIPSPSSSTQQPQTQYQQQFNRFSQLPLDAPTEFQQMVANSVGKMLPIFGANLFRNPPSTFAPATTVPVTPDYVIGPGDELVIQSWGQVSTDGRFRVDRSGDLFVPQVGTLHVAGMRFDQVQPALKSRMDKLFRNYSVNVTMGQLRSIQVFVVGQARQPGTYTISSLSTLVNAIFTTGGPSPQGSLRHIQLKRSGKLIVDFDLYDLLIRGDKSKDVPLLAGDVIYIPPVGPQVAVAGNVKLPAIYELRSPENTTVNDVLELAAGLTSTASQDKIRLERIDNRHMRQTMEVSLETEATTTYVQDGDLLEVVAVAGEFKDSVILRGNVANPGRYAWKPGMRVKDLIPTKDALITRDYWLKRSQLGQPMLTYIPTCLPTTPYGVPNLRYGVPVGEEGDDPFWRYSSNREYQALKGYPAVNFDRDPNKNDLLSPSTMYLRRDQSRQSTIDTDGGLDCSQYVEVPYYISNFAVSQLTNSQNLNNTTNPEAVTQTQLLPATTSNQASTASASLGTNSLKTPQTFRPKNDVKLSEPDIDWSYAVIERQSKENLTTSLLPFNLGKVVLEGDASQNLELEPGDVVTIFSKADLRVPQSQQTRFVRLEGEFASSGIYSVKPGETLRQLVARAGGLSPDAYLYGAEFTRESTRRVQQQRLNEYVDQIALQASTIATSNASRSINPQDTAAATAQQAQSQTIIANLRRARASGRVVLELPPDANNVNQLPDLPLEDGDRFIVPRVPSTVSIEGAVYNQNAFLYDPHRRLGDYLKLAGGATRDADKNRAYVVRAGGAVISKQYSSSLRGNGFDSIRLYPGDTVVIPLNLDKGKTMRMVVDIAQIVGQFGIAIAAANTVLGQ